MKGIVLAGGTGTRLLAATKISNKHMQLVYDRPMIYFPLQTLVDAGIEEIMIICGGEHIGQFAEQLGDGSRFKEDMLNKYGYEKDFKIELTYKVQEKAGGIAEALGLAKRFLNHDNCVVILGDNLFEENFAGAIKKFSSIKSGAYIFLKEIPEAQLYRSFKGMMRARFGIAEIANGKITRIIEKPTQEQSKSRLAVTGIYMYTPDVFDKIAKLKPSWRGELEITDINQMYLDEGKLGHEILKGFWSDAGTPETVLRAAKFISDMVEQTTD